MASTGKPVKSDLKKRTASGTFWNPLSFAFLLLFAVVGTALVVASQAADK